MRAGIQSIPRGQVHAGQALGMTYGQNMRMVILPQAFRNMIPLLLTQGIILFQDTSLAYVTMNVLEFFGSSDTVGRRDGRQAELILFAGFAYFVVSFAASRAVKQLERRLAR